MNEMRREQIKTRLREMTCDRSSPPIDSFHLGWALNEDGTKTFWCVGPGQVLVEGTTVHADTDVADFETLREFLSATTSHHETVANDLMR